MDPHETPPANYGTDALRDGYNPDRVKIEETVRTEEVALHHPSTFEGYSYHLAGPLRFHPGLENVRPIAASASVLTLIGAGILSVATNVGVETQAGGSNEQLTDAKQVEKGLAAQSVETFARNVQQEVCKYIDGDFMHRFTTKNPSGKEEFNPGAFIVPFAVSLTEDCRAQVEVEIHIPYDFARTFREAIAKNPAGRDKLVSQLTDFIHKEAENQVVIRGVAGVTHTAMVWNKQTNSLLMSGKPSIDFGTFDIPKDLTLEGSASAEAERSVGTKDAESLQGFNRENIHLAEKRLNEFSPMLRDALNKLGIDSQVLAQAKTFSYEHNMVDSEIHDLAEVSRQVFGSIIQGSDSTLAFMLVKEYNAKNPLALKAIADVPGGAERLKSLLDDQRGVTVRFTAETEFTKENVYNIALPFPLFLLLLGSLRLGASRGLGYMIEGVMEVSVPDSIIEQDVHMFEPISRRLFSETTPGTLEKPRDFNEIYDELDTTSRPEDSHNLLVHMLIEEVMPNMYPDSKEPMTDYESLINTHRDQLHSNTRKEGVTKGSYDTSEEAQRGLTEALVEMWERHDAETYPMKGIDTREVLNYRHSEHVVYWAKVLAECLIPIMQQSLTTEEAHGLLEETILSAINAREAQGRTHNNKLVTSQLPLH